jgi:predicted RNase H-like nuclease
VRALGVDAAGKRGWAGVVIDDDGFVSAHIAVTLTELMGLVDAGGPVDAVGIDIPIGLVAAARRAADVAARAYVGPRGPSVFPAPHPAVVHLDDYDEVNRLLRGMGLAAMSKQGFGLFARIREAALLAVDPRVIEVFPEASFCALGGAHLRSSKKTWNGGHERLRLLAAAEPSIVLPADLGPAGSVPTDDVFDAAAGAWSALRHAHGRAIALGDPDEVDRVTGRRIAVWV